MTKDNPAPKQGNKVEKEPVVIKSASGMKIKHN